MRTKQLAAEYEKTFALVFEEGDDPIEGIGAFAREEHLTAAHFTGIGAFSELVVGYLDPERKEYARIPISEQVEVLTLTGDVAVDEQGNPQVHAHVVVGKSDASAHGGHLLEACVWPTLEVVLVESPSALRKQLDPETGLALISIDA